MRSPLTFTNFFRKSVLFSAVAAALAFSSCSKNKDYVYTPAITYLETFNALVSTSSLDVYVGDNPPVKLNTTPFSFGQNTTDFFRFGQGYGQVAVTLSGSTTVLFAKTIALQSPNIYSGYIVGDKAEKERMDYLLIRNVGITLATGKSAVRLLNLSPDAPAVNVEISSDATTKLENVAYKGNTDFKATPIGTGVTLTLKNTTTGAVLATLPNVEFKDGIYYSVLAYGLVNATDATKIALKVNSFDPKKFQF
ncbi:DUF4397 domain-containing protein [Pedobacter nutrimenti]|jgi:hypothetical protein|uniref:Uncharacterized protein DUF4397 n=1 Tax=Pedobacter nutrimenti TaxID=1241337 RepID=A0A318UQA3_9SPHI|nr:DUF4397 domain-containing protein [Pedobacter nutrimenti]PYF77258.1 uncharacterized protein DUF4397 [Pedobacter nutrimenti]